MKVLTCELFIFLIYFAFVRSQSGFIPTNYEEVTKPTPGGFGAIPKCGEGKGEGLFKCVEYHRCDPDTNTITPEINTNGFGLIDIRFGENSCEHPLDVCCKIPPGGDTQTSLEPSPLTPPTPYPVPAPVSSCGIRNNNGVDFKITGNSDNEAEYGEFPWMVAILKKNYDPSVDPVLAICGGSLITPGVVLTAAHCVYKSSINDIKIRAGEWDTQTEKERLPYQERDISEIILHENFKNGTLFNDVALLILDKPLKKAEHIGTICLPNQDEIIDSKNCFASGWGKDNFGRDGQYQVILKKIELPIVLHEQCQNLLRETRLGKFFKLDQSFTCAGGVEGKDTCTGDGGSPLVCPDPNQSKRYVQAGIVAWGIGCGTNIPGVYADVSKFRNWIDKHMQRLNIDTKPYTS